MMDARSLSPARPDGGHDHVKSALAALDRGEEPNLVLLTDAELERLIDAVELPHAGSQEAA
jgi:hypothetical protein